MNLIETLKLLRMKEKETGALLKYALSLGRNRVSSNYQFFQNSDAFALSAINGKARIKWGAVFIEQIFHFFDIADHEYGP
jgi:hypothetical protein